MTWHSVSDGFERTPDGRFDLIRTPDRIGSDHLWLVIDGDYGRTFKGFIEDCAAWARDRVAGSEAA